MTGPAPTPSAALSTRALRWLEFPAHLAVLNLCWLAAALPVVTSYGAGIALQVALRAWREEGESRVAAVFFREFRARVRGSLPLAAAGLGTVAGLWLSASFWLGAPGPLLAAATAVLLPLAVVTAAVHLTVFEVAARSPGAGTGRWVREALLLSAARPARCLGALLLCATWAALLWRLPQLVPLWGVSVPALALGAVPARRRADAAGTLSAPS
ncbi:DUF624 domain-containing protein [Streptomyces corynorhini]|uniref:DUF624 domain-containing protein n=1 Tax=Streptomyces corynorhini TaxID=2282652 RepID=A0A370BHK4_9ACTN|nr:DUF624 domain-containing protein [Streptomyces corynorhini]RDG38865.1 hypothetical protein DVH02_06980 [Streptomyces corynorhini]